MKKQTIEVDQEIFDFLKSKAEPFVDSPNDVLRRLLLTPDSKVNRSTSISHTITPPSVPAGCPKALEHILQVVYLSCFQGLSRSKATNRIAKLNGIRPQTVLDKYCRQLNLKALEFDKLLSEEGLNSLKKILLTKFIDHSDVIESYLQK